MSSNHKWHSVSAEEALKMLETTHKEGLSTSEAEKRLEKYGKNELLKEAGITPLQLFINQFKDFLIIILILAAIISGIFGLLQIHDWSDPVEVLEALIDSIAIFAIVIINGLLGFYQEYKAEKSLEALEQLTAPHAAVIRDGKEQMIQSADLVPGDIVLLEAGDSVPADIRLLEAFSLQAEEASLTGESVPVKKKAEDVLPKDTLIGDRSNLVFMGTNLSYGRGVGVVVDTGMESQLGQIAGMLSKVEMEETPLQQDLEVFGKRLGYGILIICAFVFVVGSLVQLLSGTGQSLYPDFLSYAIEGVFIEMFLIAVALAVAAIPEGLPAVVTVALALGVQRMVKRNAIIRKLHAVETLGSTTVICSDKTGTLTQNKMTVREVVTLERNLSVTGTGYNYKGEFQENGKKVDPLQSATISYLLKTALLCNDSNLEKSTDGKSGDPYSIIGDPTEGALLFLAGKAGLDHDEADRLWPRVYEFPFDSERKRMSTIHDAPFDPERKRISTIHLTEEGKCVALIKGAPDVLLALSSHYASDQNGKMPLGEAERTKIEEINKQLAAKAYRILAFGYKELREDEFIKVKEIGDFNLVECDIVFLGSVGMIDPPREETAPAIEACKTAGMVPVMITGDHQDTALAVAREIGMVHPDSDLLTGRDLEVMTEADLDAVVENVSVYARVSPAHKLDIVTSLQKKNHIVAMTGDGVNDAPALKKANIGVAMGITGTDVSREASEMVLTDDNFASIVAAVEEGRAIYANIKKFISYLLSCNAGEVLTVFFGLIFGLILFQQAIPVLLAIQILWVNLATDGLPALALGVDPAEKGIMKRPPRDPNEGILTSNLMSQIILAGIVISVFTLFAFFEAIEQAIALDPGFLTRADFQNTFEFQHAQTLALTVLITFQMMNAINCRAEKDSLIGIGIFGNKWLFGAIALSFALHALIIYTPFGWFIFKTVPLNPFDWIEVLILSFSIVIVEEVRKFIFRRLESQKT
ncbi:MAG: calcium-translocating P-type ATPase, SERCA-type [Promethearchaeota archaeon]